MLTKRTNILFDEQLWKALTAEAKKRKTSVARLVRKAVEKEYFEDTKWEERRRAFEEIKKIRKISKTRIDYKALINYGRKY